MTSFWYIFEFKTWSFSIVWDLHTSPKMTLNLWTCRTVGWKSCVLNTHTNKDTTYKQPSTAAACETEACSPLVSFNINGFPDRSVGGTGREKTRQIAGGDRFSVELLKYAPYQNAKQLKGSPYFSRRPPDSAALPTVGKTSSSTFIRLLYFSCLPSSLPVFFPLSMLSFSWHFVSFYFPYSFFSFFRTFFFVTYCFPSLDLDLSSLHPLILSSSSITPLNFPCCLSWSPTTLLFPPSSLCLLFFFPTFSCILPWSLLSSSPPLFPPFPLSLFLLSDWSISTRGGLARRWLRKAFHIRSPFPWEQPAVHSYLSVCLHLASARC